jgi:acetyl-CoA acetyltransferase
MLESGFIVGVGLSDIGTPRVEGVSSGDELAAQAALRALDDAGIPPSEVDGLFHCAPDGIIATTQLAEYMGLPNVRYFDSTWVGGASWVAYLQHALAAIHAGECQVALIAYGEAASTRTRKRMPPVMPFYPDSMPSQFELVHGPFQPTNYALVARRHMHEFGTTSEQLAEIAVSTRAWAGLNPLARFRDPMTIQDVLDSRPIADPLHLLDCCLVSDGGGAVVLASKAVAEGLGAKSVQVSGIGVSQSHVSMSQMGSLTLGPARASGERAFAMAGIERDAIDLAMVYDSFTITVLLALEDLGFCEKGEGGEFVSGQRTAPGGDFPLNTNGGGLSFCHPGMYGVFTVIEAVTQLRGVAGERQLDECGYALAHATGGDMSVAATAILTT